MLVDLLVELVCFQGHSNFLILFYSIYRSDFFACVSVHHVYVVHAEDRTGCQLPLVVTMWVLETVLGSPGNAAISVNQWAVSAAPRKVFNVLSPVCTSWSPWCCYQLTLHSRTHSVVYVKFFTMQTHFTIMEPDTHDVTMEPVESPVSHRFSQYCSYI